MELKKYDVGSRVCSPSEDGVVFDMTDAGGLLLIKLRQPTPKERKAFDSGVKIKVAIRNQIIFLLVRMGELNWMDAPYYKQRSTQLTMPILPDDGLSVGIHTMLIDASTGILVAQKLVSPDTRTGRALIAAITAQPEIPDYDMRLQQTYRSNSTTDLLRYTV